MTLDIVNKYLDYDRNTGILTRKFKYHGNVIAGKRACRPCVNKKQNHLSVVLCGRDYPAHRIIWLIVYGEFPQGHIDHIDHDETNNKLSNLRVVSQYANNRNSSLRCDNAIGITGVWINPRVPRKKYTAEIRDTFGKKIYKAFYTLEDAINQRKMWEKEFGYHENHGIRKPL